MLTLVMKWSWGKESPQEIQHMMGLYKTDLAAGANLDTSLVDILAGLGNSGANPQHCHAHMVERLPATMMPQKSMFNIPTNHSVYGPGEGLIGAIWPHEVFASLYHNYKEAFFAHLVGPAGAVRAFWTSVQGRACTMCITFVFCIACLLGVSFVKGSPIYVFS